LADGDGPRIHLVPTPNGRNAMAQLVSGAVDAATGSETQALLNSVADPRIRIVLTLSECRYRIVARRSAGIRRISDLRGKKVGVTLNTSSYYYLAAMLRHAHIEESDVQLVALEGQDMPAALKAQNVDAVSIWEPHAQNSLEALGNDAVVFQDASVYTERFNLNTRADVLADAAKRLALVRFIQAIDRASVRLRNRPTEMIPALAPKINLAERTIMAVWPQFNFPASLPRRLQPALNEIEPWVAAMQKRESRPARDLTALIDTSVIDEVQRRNATFRFR
jgi:NitT/TauT family transport system substrate-binding protein